MEENENIKSSLGVYEVGYLMVPTIAEENLGAEVTKFKDSMSEKGAVFVSDEYPKMIELAYEMSRSVDNKKQKFSYGYFGWVKFECTPEETVEIKNMLDKDQSLIRYLLIKTVRENTMSPKKPFNRQDSSKKKVVSKPQNNESQKEEKIDEKVIDKEIDALVVE